MQTRVRSLNNTCLHLHTNFRALLGGRWAGVAVCGAVMVIVGGVIMSARSWRHEAHSCEPLVDINGALQGIWDGDVVAPVTSTILASSQLGTAPSPIHRHRTTAATYDQDGGRRTVNGLLWLSEWQQSFEYRVEYEPTAGGAFRVRIRTISDAPAESESPQLYYCLLLPASDFMSGTVSSDGRSQSTTPFSQISKTRMIMGNSRGLQVAGRQGNIEVHFGRTSAWFIRLAGSREHKKYAVCVPLRAINQSGGVSEAGLSVRTLFVPMSRPLSIAIDATKRTKRFDGIGGNVRIYWPTKDLPIVNYNVDHLDIAWARVPMAISGWPRDSDGVASRGAKSIAARDIHNIQLAQQLSRKNIPLVMSIWSVPDWAMRKSDRHRLSEEEKGKLCSAICSYLKWAQKHYDVVPELLSFNEPDISSFIHLHPTEYSEILRQLCAKMSAEGITTKLLLGDTSNPSTSEYILPAMEDPEIMQHVGAIGFHSWHGGTTSELKVWRTLAAQAGVPVMCTEGGVNPDAGSYPDFLEEPWLALQEAQLYVRICRVAEPSSILQWQLTSDFSLLRRDSTGRLRETQRFWNLKQLGLTPRGARFATVSCDDPQVECVAFREPQSRTLVLHIVNVGSARSVTLAGLPASTREMRSFVTNGTMGMQRRGTITVERGASQFYLTAAAFTTLLGSY